MSEMKPLARRQRVTIATVAADAGVSVAAVSKVLRNAYGVSEALRAKVTASIDRLGYRPSVAARGMRGKTYRIGILLVEIANPFLSAIIDGINSVIEPSDYRAMLAIGQSDTPIENSLVESMIDYRMDGLILVAPMSPDDLLSRFAKQIPVVVIGHHDVSGQDFDTVNGGDRPGAELAVQALIERGHRHVAMMTPEIGQHPPGSVIRQRELGYRDAMTKAGLGEYIRLVRVLNTRSQGAAQSQRESAIRQLLTAEDRPSAIFCWSDLDGVDVVNIARTMGVSVPGDIAVVGYDNSPVAALPLIGLSSVDQQGRRLGELAARALLGRIEGRSTPLHIEVEPHLVLRSST